MSEGVRTLRRLSVVAPAYNEAANLIVLAERLQEVLGGLGCDWEIVIVDDGSTDDTAELLRSLHGCDSRIRGVLLSRNFGHEAAVTAGIDAARGDAVVLMDADLQDPPELIAAFVAKWREGYDIVAAQRTSREGDSAAKRLGAFLFYRFMNRIVRWDFPQDIGNFRLMDRAAVEALKRCPERSRFVRALTAWTGFRQTSVPFDRARRHAGKTKYTTRKTAALAVASITSFSYAPLRAAAVIGLALAAPAGLALGYMTVRALLGSPPGMGAALLASVWFLGGLQCFLLGIAGEYIGRIYTEARQRPLYIVREAIG